MKYDLVDPSVIFVDSTHVKARANSKKMRKRVAKEQALWFAQELVEEINKDREAHGKKPLKEKKDDDKDPPIDGAVPEGVIRNPKMSGHRNAVQQIRKADGFGRENINMFSPMRLKRPVINTGGYLVTACIRGMNMTAAHLKSYMIK